MPAGEAPRSGCGAAGHDPRPQLGIGDANDVGPQTPPSFCGDEAGDDGGHAHPHVGVPAARGHEADRGATGQAVAVVLLSSAVSDAAPTLVSVAVTDRVSGLASGSIEISSAAIVIGSPMAGSTTSAATVAPPPTRVLTRAPNSLVANRYQFGVNLNPGASSYEVRFARGGVTGPDGAITGPSAQTFVNTSSGLADFRTWHGEAFGAWTPWGGHEHRGVVAEAETALERQLSGLIMRGGARPRLRKVAQGELLTEQDRPGDELYLVLDGMLTVEVDGEPVAEVGPGAIIGERATLEGGARTATLRATTRCRVAVARADEVDHTVLRELAEGHHREEQPTPDPAIG